MKTLVREYLSKDKYINIIEKYIFFDGSWMFVEKESLSMFLGYELPYDFFDYANSIVTEFNEKNIKPDDYNILLFNSIVKKIDYIKD